MVEAIVRQMVADEVNRLSVNEKAVLRDGIQAYLHSLGYDQRNGGAERAREAVELLPALSGREQITFFSYFGERTMAEGLVSYAENAATSVANGELPMSEEESRELLQEFLSVTRFAKDNQAYRSWLENCSRDLMTALRYATGKSNEITQNMIDMLRP